MIIQQVSLFETQPSLIDSNENYTPSDLIDLVHKFYGFPELDPFSCEQANQIIKAQKIFTIQDDGFKQNWRRAKTLWLNPPYSAGFIEKVVDKLIATLNETEAEAFLLTNTDNSTAWYKKALNRCDRFCLPSTRLTFPQTGSGGEETESRFSQTLFYFGLQPQRFEEIFEGWGTVCQTSKW